MQIRSVHGWGFKEKQHTKLYAFSKLLMGKAPRKYTQISIINFSKGRIPQRLLGGPQHYFLAEKLSIRRNCTSHILPAIQYLEFLHSWIENTSNIYR